MVRGAFPVLAMALLLGFAKPFSGDPPLSAPVRYAFWIGMVCLGYVFASAAEKLIPERLGRHRPLRLFAAALTSALPLTFVTTWVIPFIRPGQPPFGLDQLPALFSIVLAVQVAIAFVLLRERDPVESSPPARTPGATGQYPRALVSRLPARLGDKIVALQAEDHYLRVHTTVGSDLVLMRLSDAIKSIEPQLGLQVHRSWWVAEDAICEMVRSAQTSHLKLSNGLSVPVGRTFSAAVRSRAPAAGN